MYAGWVVMYVFWCDVVWGRCRPFFGSSCGSCVCLLLSLVLGGRDFARVGAAAAVGIVVVAVAATVADSDITKLSRRIRKERAIQLPSLPVDVGVCLFICCR